MTNPYSPERLKWILDIGVARQSGMMPWCANPPTLEDATWCDDIIRAMQEKKNIRPLHPDPDIEDMLKKGGV